jgi:hypothetical protein
MVYAYTSYPEHERTTLECENCNHRWFIALGSSFFWVESKQHRKAFRWPNESKLVLP